MRMPGVLLYMVFILANNQLRVPYGKGISYRFVSFTACSDTSLSWGKTENGFPKQLLNKRQKTTARG
jgi:hypothetical protein